jgi:hypothetical protein
MCQLRRCLSPIMMVRATFDLNAEEYAPVSFVSSSSGFSLPADKTSSGPSFSAYRTGQAFGTTSLRSVRRKMRADVTAAVY